MSRVIGIDVRDDAVVLAQIRLVSRKIHVEHLVVENSVALLGREGALLAAVERVGGVKGHGVDSVAVALEGARTIVTHVTLPGTAERRFEELLPFELESDLPMEVDEVVSGHQLFARKRGALEPVRAVVLSAPKVLVRAQIEGFRATLGREPDVIGQSAFSLGLLTLASPTLKKAERAFVLDVGVTKTDVCLIERAVSTTVRSLSVGTTSFPEKAENFVAQLKQTFAALGGTEGATVHVVGDGAILEGLAPFLEARLGIPVAPLSDFVVEGIGAERMASLAQHARALALALQAGTGKGIDLRRGEFAVQRGYSFLKEKAPLLGALTAAVIVSFVFSTWAEARATDKETTMLEASLGALTKTTFNQEVTTLEDAEALFEAEHKAKPEDPMPYLDGFGAMVALSEQVPDGIKHDVEQLELSKGKLKIRGQVDSNDEAQKVQKALEEHRCLENVTVAKMTQVVNSSRTRYHLEADVRCPEETQPEKKKPVEAAPAEGEGE